jgi:cobyrinic acid a,c-diamide synthase
MKGLIVAAPRSGAGKTTIALGLMRALARRGFAVQPFKCGPDYIDPGFHAVAAGRPSFNLDGWAMSPATLAGLATARAADIAVVEGVMGLFDGAAGEGQSSRGATADLAALLGWPVVLVLDVTGQAETAVAVAAGCVRYRDDVAIAGVILNRVASPRHLSFIAPALEKAGIRLLGALPNHAGLTLPERHLGLVQASETGDLSRRLDAFADALEATVDLVALRGLAIEATHGGAPQQAGLRPPGQRIALARDRAFSFVYPHLLEAWRAAGAEIVPFSPLADEAPHPRADAVWLPGGYPELHAGALAAARRFRAGLQDMAKRATPIHGECGGYMVLGQGIEDTKGGRHAMAGLLTLETSFAKRSLHLGYRRARLLPSNCVLGPPGTELFGHEFHYAGIVTSGDEPLVECVDASGAAVEEQGARRGAVSGTFFHVIDVAASPSSRAERSEVEGPVFSARS